MGNALRNISTVWNVPIPMHTRVAPGRNCLANQSFNVNAIIGLDNGNANQTLTIAARMVSCRFRMVCHGVNRVIHWQIFRRHQFRKNLKYSLIRNVLSQEPDNCNTFHSGSRDR